MHMNACEAMRALLPLFNTGDLSSGESHAVESHLALCAVCMSVRDEYRTLDSISRKKLPGMYSLHPATRNRIAAEAAERRRTSTWGWPIVSVSLWPAWQRMIPAGAAVLVALLALPFYVTRYQERSAGRQEFARISVVAAPGVVRLAWSDGVKPVYTVSKSSDPRTPGQSYQVRGHVWIDENPESSQVVFYRIE